MADIIERLRLIARARRTKSYDGNDVLEAAAEITRLRNEIKSVTKSYQEACSIASEAQLALTTAQAAEAQMREALSSLLNCIDGVHDPEWLDRCKCKAREVLNSTQKEPQT